MTLTGRRSHTNPETPGTIHEGGELGYALSVAFVAVMDNLDLVVAWVVRYGEVETGQTATAWHGYRYIGTWCSAADISCVRFKDF